jgi:hypothetical protein
MWNVWFGMSIAYVTRRIRFEEVLVFDRGLSHRRRTKAQVNRKGCQPKDK